MSPPETDCWTPLKRCIFLLRLYLCCFPAPLSAPSDQLKLLLKVMTLRPHKHLINVKLSPIRTVKMKVCDQVSRTLWCHVILYWSLSWCRTLIRPQMKLTDPQELQNTLLRLEEKLTWEQFCQNMRWGNKYVQLSFNSADGDDELKDQDSMRKSEVGLVLKSQNPWSTAANLNHVVLRTSSRNLERLFL